MNPQLGRVAFRVATYLVLMSSGMLLLLQPGTGEFVVTVITLAMGLLFGGVIAVLARRAQRLRPREAASAETDPGDDSSA